MCLNSELPSQDGILIIQVATWGESQILAGLDWLFDLLKACRNGRKLIFILVHTLSDVWRNWSTMCWPLHMSHILRLFGPLVVGATVVISWAGFGLQIFLCLARLPLDWGRLQYGHVPGLPPPPHCFAWLMSALAEAIVWAEFLIPSSFFPVISVHFSNMDYQTGLFLHFFKGKTTSVAILWSIFVSCDI